MDTKKSMIWGFGAFSHSFLINNGNDDKSEIQEMSKIIFNEIQRRILLLNYPLYRVQFISYFTLFFPASFSISSLVTSKTSNKKMKIGIPIINPHTPKKCSEKINTINV